MILASNHQCWADPILVSLGVEREIHFMARSSLFRLPLFRAAIGGLNAFPIDRDAADVRGMKEAVERLKAGHALLMFPEGTRTRDGLIAPLKGGVGFLAERTGVPVVPVLISGAFEAWPKSQVFPLPGRVTVVYGRPVNLEKDFSDTLRRLFHELRNVPRHPLERKDDG